MLFMGRACGLLLSSQSPLQAYNYNWTITREREREYDGDRDGVDDAGNRVHERPSHGLI